MLKIKVHWSSLGLHLRRVGFCSVGTLSRALAGTKEAITLEWLPGFADKRRFYQAFKFGVIVIVLEENAVSRYRFSPFEMHQNMYTVTITSLCQSLTSCYAASGSGRSSCVSVDTFWWTDYNAVMRNVCTAVASSLINWNAYSSRLYYFWATNEVNNDTNHRYIHTWNNIRWTDMNRAQFFFLHSQSSQSNWSRLATVGSVRRWAVLSDPAEPRSQNKASFSWYKGL